MLEPGTSPPYQPPARSTPSDARLTTVAVTCALVAFPSAAFCALASLMYHWVAFLTLVSLSLAFVAVRSAWQLPRKRRALRISLLRPAPAHRPHSRSAVAVLRQYLHPRHELVLVTAPAQLPDSAAGPG